MKTITTCVHDIIRHQPFLDDAIARDIINFSGLADDIQPIVEEEMKKPVKPGSIIMALRRYAPKRTKINMKALRELGDIVVRSGITEYTYLNSNNILSNQAKLMDAAKDQHGVYLNYSSNFRETNILVSTSLTNLVEDCFKNEVRVSVKNELSSISIGLPQNSSQTVGLYFYLFKLLAYEGIPVFEMISTSNFFTIFLEKEYVNQAFLLLNEIKE